MTRARIPSAMDPLCVQLVGAREQSGLTRTQLAKKIGVDRRDLWNWETGRHTPNLFFFRAWAEALGFNPEITPKSAKEQARAA